MVKTDKEGMKEKNMAAKRTSAARQTRVIAPLLTHGSLEARLWETEIEQRREWRRESMQIGTRKSSVRGGNGNTGWAQGEGASFSF